ncbi:uncharacterized protein FTOL_06225 [Fusarium torulosum]|uniref:Uncharacterized protein n=1 Tax=Fusarium torulosum TaxID=33205 RepID=A0AAE8MB11_9HYPO|nr:uncharacterized protein FTOL_06225 [Fusarium torulosum]
MSELTFEALSRLNSQMASLSVTRPASEDMDDCSSECSHYSLAGLENDKWYRYILASQVREQAKLVPDLPTRPGEAKYPRPFYNREALPLQKAGSWREYPFCLNKRYVHGTPGPVRIVVNSTSNDDHDVIYHPTKDNKMAILATYRPRGYAKGVLPKPLPVSSPSSLSSSPVPFTYSPVTFSSSPFTSDIIYQQYLPPAIAYMPNYDQPFQASYCQPSVPMDPTWNYPMGYNTGFPHMNQYLY